MPGDEIKVLTFDQKGTLLERVSDQRMASSNWHYENEGKREGHGVYRCPKTSRNETDGNR